jgi:LemA protein
MDPRLEYLCKGNDMGAWWIVLAVGIVLVLIVVGLFNALVRKRVRCQEAWSQIDVQLKRRYDLIPNVVETVKGYARHEKEALERVVQARSAAMAVPPGSVQQQAQAENVLTGALRQLFALSESYPDLKANQNFLQLQEELASTENRIAFARQHYNDTAALYNAARETFPSNVIAGAFNFQRRDYFEIDQAAQREAPKVQF